MGHKVPDNKKREALLRKKLSLCMMFVLLCLIGMGIGGMGTVNAAEGDSCTANFSNISVSSRYGCNAQNVYQYCTFYANFWNPNGNLHLRSATVTLKRNGTTVFSNTAWSSDSNHYFNYASIPIYITETGTYTVERSVTKLDGGTLYWDTANLTVYSVASCPTNLSLSSSSLFLDMTGTNSGSITAKISEVFPDRRTFQFECSDYSVASCRWGGWYDSDGDGENDANTVIVSGEAGGTATVTVRLLETTTETVVASKTFTVTVGPNYTVSYHANGGSGAPSSQTKYYGKTLTLRSERPNRTGYTFQGWATSATAASASYMPGGGYTLNQNNTLYAVWNLNTISLSDCIVLMPSENYVYDGREKKPEVSVSHGSNVLIQGVDYTVTYSNNVNAGTASITVTGKGKYTGTITRTFTIKKADMEVEAHSVSEIYDGFTHAASISVTKPSSYQIYYSTAHSLNSGNYQSASTAKPARLPSGETTVYYYITEGSGNYNPYAGSVSIVVLPKVVMEDYSGVYDGSPHRASVSVSGNATLYYSTSTYLNYNNYRSSGTLQMPERTSAGTTTVYMIAVPDAGASSSSVRTETAIIEISKANQDLTAEISPSRIEVGGTAVITASATAGALHYSTSDSSVVAVNSAGVVTGISQGTAEITVEAAATANYSSARKSLTIVVAESEPTSIADCGIVLSPDSFIYNGSICQPEVTVTYGGKTLVQDIDYTVTYTNHVNAGTALVVIDGKGNYIGTVSRSFSIRKASQALALNISSNSIKVGDTAAITASGAVGTLRYESDHPEVASVSSTGVVTGIFKGTATITVTASATENYEAAVKKAVIMVTDSASKMIRLSDCDVSLSDDSYVYDGTAKEPKVLIEDQGAALTKGRDYTVQYSNQINAGTASVTVTGIGRYTGTLEFWYTIQRAEPILRFASSTLSKEVTDSTFTNQLEAVTDGTVSFTSSDVGVAEVDAASGEVTIRGVGVVMIQAEASRGMNYVDGKASYTLTVGQSSREMSLLDLSYRFANERNAFGYPSDYNIPLSSFQIIFGDTTKAKSYYKTKSQGKKWGGNCAGFSGTSALLHDTASQVSARDFNPLAGHTSELFVSDWNEKLQMNVTTFIEAMQVAQYTKLFKDANAGHRVYTDLIKQGTKNLNQLYKEVKEQVQARKPVVITLYQQGSGHAVLAYQVEDVSGTESRMHLYDNNYPLEERYLTLRKDTSGNFVEWSYEIGGNYGVWGSDVENSSIGYVEYSVIREIWDTRGHLSENENIVSLNSQSAAIYNSDDKLVATILQGKIYTRDKRIQLVEELSLDAEGGGILLSVPVDIYTIVNLDRDMEEFEVSMANTNLGATVSTTVKEVVLAVDDSCNLNAVYIDAKEEDTYCVTLNSTYAYDDDDVMIQGKGSGQTLEISQTKGNISINNCWIFSITIDGMEIQKYGILASAAPGGTITPSGESVVVQGGSQTYQIQPDSGYMIQDVKVDGKSVGVCSSYTFKKVSEDHTIEAVFSKAKKNKITAANITKVTSSKTQKFSLGAKALGNAKLTYHSSHSAVKVSSKGQVTVKKNFVGKATITITAKQTASYMATSKRITVTVKPTGTTISKVTNSSTKKLTVKWKRNPSVTGYHIQYSTSSSFQGSKTIKISKNKTISTIISGVKKKKNYYIRIRTYQKAAGKVYYSKWSNVKKVKVSK